MNARDGDPLDVTPLDPVVEQYRGRMNPEVFGVFSRFAGAIKGGPDFDPVAMTDMTWEGRRSSSKAWLLLALGVGAALGFVAGWVAR